MCGHKFSEETLTLSLKKIRYRGPDETITAVFPKLHTFFGMNRLAIRDIHRGLYPFSYHQLTLIFNGEIYNLSELQKLIPEYHPQTTCDAELVLPLYTKFGTKAFNLLTGMFAIAILDQKKQQIILARDKFGEKPLYYYHSGGQFFFASEITAFPDPLKKIRASAIPEFLTFGFIPSHQTFFQNISKLKAGEYAIYNISTQRITISSYSTPQTPLPIPTENQLDSLLNNIIKGKMVSDVPLGTFLSGGVDSSLITAIAQKESPAPLHTFSIGFKEKTVDESQYAKLVAKHLGTHHHHVIFTAQDVSRLWPKIIDSIDEPLSDPALFPTYLLAQTASKYVKVVLSGEGADELFGGYSQYQRETQLSRFPFLKNPLTQFIAFHTANQKYWRLFSPITSHYTQTIYQSLWHGGYNTRSLYQHLIEANWHEFITNYHINPRLIPQCLQQHDLTYYLPEQLCMKVDKMTMRHSLETRAPFLDARLLPFLPTADNKKILRHVAANYLPPEITHRPKHGFTLPLAKWLKTVLRPELNNLHQAHTLLTSYLSQNTINLLVDDFLSTGANELTLWNLLTLNSWLNHQVNPLQNP